MQTSPDHTQVYTNAPALLRSGYLFWLPSVYFILHTIEELPGFAAWASRHFGVMTTETFAFIHMPLLLLVFLASYKAATVERPRGWAVLVTAAQWQFGVNALFHLGTALIFREYAPGMVTAVCLALPLTTYFVMQVWREKRLTKNELTTAISLGTVMAGAAVGFLFLP